MKNKVFTVTFVAGLFLLAGCSSELDSNDVAKEINDQRIENADDTAPESKASASKNDQKDVAEYMINLADIGLIKQAMSTLAVERATNPAVQAYARETVKQQIEKIQTLKAQSQQYTIMLPSTPSNTSQLMLAKLKKEDAGADFDRTYLGYMAELNDQAISKAKNLIKNTDKPALVSFAENIIAVDQQRMEKATSIKKNVD